MAAIVVTYTGPVGGADHNAARELAGEIGTKTGRIVYVEQEKEGST